MTRMQVAPALAQVLPGPVRIRAYDGSVAGPQDARVSIDIVTPDGRVHPLNYWSVVTSAFSNAGPRAEWRMQRGRPIALIVRVNASEDGAGVRAEASAEGPADVTSAGIVPPATDAGNAVGDTTPARCSNLRNASPTWGPLRRAAPGRATTT